jgi:hypothetical protein
MKYYIFIFLTLISTSLSAIQADPKLRKPLNKILAHPSSAALIRAVEKDGEIYIAYESFGDQDVNALWDADNRIICINNKNDANAGCIISSILFELHNAASTNELKAHFDQAGSGRYSKEQFVEAIERMEHRNALAAQNLIDQGVLKGYFPQSSRIFHFDNFDDYYALQQLFGHSQWIAERYDHISPRHQVPYKGTISQLPLHTRQDRLLFLDYLAMKNEPELAQLSERLNWLEKRFAKASSNEIAMLNFLFTADLEGNPLYFARGRPLISSI